MAVEVVENFESNTLAGYSVTGSPTTSTTAAIHGTYGLLISGAGTRYITHTMSPATPLVIVGRIYLRLPTGGTPVTANQTAFVGHTSAGQSFHIQVSTAGHLVAQVVGGTLRDFGAMTLDHAYYVDFRCTCASTTGTIEWAVDGVSQTNATGTITSSTFLNARLGNENGSVTAGTLHIDDWTLSQTNGDYPFGPVNPGSFLGMTERLFSYGFSAATHSAHSWLEMESVWLPWKNVNTARASYTWTVLNQWLDDADTNGYTINIRVVAGGSSPTWIYTDGTNPVQKIHLYNPGETASGGHDAPVPWDANLRVLWRLMLASLKTNLDANTTGGHARKGFVNWMAVAMPADPGTEMWTLDETKNSLNLAKWDAVSTGATSALKAADRRAKITTAWDNALDDMLTYIPTIAPCLAGGGLFGDGQAKAVSIPADRVATMPNLIVMETNAQPKQGTGTSAGKVVDTWKSFNGTSYHMLSNAIAVGLGVGMQTAAESVFSKFNKAPWSPTKAFEYMCREMIGIMLTTDPGYPSGYDMPLMFLEPNPALLATNATYSQTVAQPAILAQDSLDAPVCVWTSGTTSTSPTYVCSFSATDDDGIQTAEVSFDTITWGPATLDPVSGDYQATVTLSSGANTLYARATDANSTPSTSTPLLQTVTLTAPSPLVNTFLPIVTPAAPLITDRLESTSGTWAGTGSATATYTYTWQRQPGGGGGYVTVQTSSIPLYQLSGTDLDATFQVLVVANNGADSSAATSAATSGAVGVPVITLSATIATIPADTTSYTFTGSVVAVGSGVTITSFTMNGSPVTVANDGSFSLTVTVASGLNLYTFTADDSASHSSTTTAQISRSFTEISDDIEQIEVLIHQRGLQ